MKPKQFYAIIIVLWILFLLILIIGKEWIYINSKMLKELKKLNYEIEQTNDLIPDINFDENH